MFTLALMGFGGHAIFNDSLGQVSVWVLIHASLMFSWLSWMSIQSFLIKRNEGQLSRTWLVWNLLMAILVLLSIVLVTIFAFQSGKRTIEDVTFNLFAAMNFTILVYYTTKYYSNSGHYERYMVMANLAIIFPALKRIAGFFNQGAELALALLSALIIGVFVYEIKVLKAVQQSSWLGLLLIVSGVLFTVILPKLKFWEAILNQVLL